ncbi:MAG: AAA family ATPase, partial [Anaerolineales bacterium]
RKGLGAQQDQLGIGAGEVSGVYLGGVFGRWEFLVVGEPLTQMSRAEKQARPGQAILSPEAWAVVQDHSTGTSLPTGYVRLDGVDTPLPPNPRAPLTLSPDIAGALRGYIPAAIRDRLAAGQAGWLAELRRVTVLFINLPDLMHDMPLAQAQTVMWTLQETLYHYEGSINKLNVDDKGVTLVAAMGLPPLSHEDDPARAVRAVLAIRAALENLGLRSAIGVTTGRAFCGSVGSDTRREYTMIGDVVNLSARLMQAAGAPATGAGILCDAATYQTARRRVSFKTLPPVRVKGKAEALLVYRPRGELTSRYTNTFTSGVMVGRKAERAALTARLRALEAGESGVVIIEGEAGIGKSRLAAELRVQVKDFPVRSLIGWADAIEKNTPYHAWRPVFARLLEIDLRADAPETQRARVHARLEDEPDLLALLPLMKAVLSLNLPDNDLTRPMKGEGRGNKTRDFLLRVLRKEVADAPLLLILGDAHWLDSASWALARFASLDVHPLLLVFVTRPLSPPLPREYQAFLEHPALSHLVLENLPPEAILQLVCDRLGVGTLPEAVTRLIRERAGGHPFFSEELAYALRDAGLIRIEDGICQLAPEAGDLSIINFPDTVQGVVASRIDKLTPQQQLALKVASVIGRVFAFRVLRDVYPVNADKPRLSDYLKRLERLDITPLETPPPDLSYIFKHIITQEVAYNLMLFAHRQRLHRAVAEWYERAYTGDLVSFYPLLAHHWTKAEVTEKAIDYLARAGEQAQRSGAYHEAIGFLIQVLALDSQLAIQRPEAGHSDLQRARWRYQLGEAYYSAGQMSASRAHLLQALVLCGHAYPPSDIAMGVSLVGQFLRQAWHRLAPRLARQPKTGDHAARLLVASQSHARVGLIAYFDNKKIPTLYSTIQGLNLAEQAGEIARTEQAIGYAGMAMAAGAVPLHNLAELYSRLTGTLVQQIDDPDVNSYVSLAVGVYALGTAQWKAAQTYTERAIQLAGQVGNVRRWEEGVGVLIEIVSCQCQWDVAVPLCDDLHTTAARQKDTQFLGWAFRHRANLAIYLGRLAPALHLIRQSLDYSKDAGLLGTTSLIYTRMGNVQLAEEYAERAAALLAGTSPTAYYMREGYTGTTEAYLTLWETRPTSKYRKLAQAACQRLSQYARVYNIGKPFYWTYRGWFHWLDGKPRKARKAGEKAVRFAQQFGMPYEEGFAHYHLGRRLPASDAARRAHLTQAIAIFERLGAAWDLERARGELEKG